MSISCSRQRLCHISRTIGASIQAICDTRPAVDTLYSPGTQCFSTTHAPQARRRPFPPRGPRRWSRIRSRSKEHNRLLSLQESIAELVETGTVEGDATSPSQSVQGHDDPSPQMPVSDESAYNKEDRIAPSRLQPPSFLQSRLAHKSEGKVRKRLPTKQETDLLQYNPYAQALASPIRTCYVTGARLPTAFLNRWGLIQHPDTKNYWLMPTSLLETELGQVDEDNHDDNEDGKEDSRRETPVRNPKRKKRVTPAYLRRTTRPMYISNNITIFHSLAQIQQNAVARNLIPLAWKAPNGPITKFAERKAVWREDMDDYVLKRLRVVATKQLKRAVVFLSHPVDRPGCVALNLGEKGGIEALKEALNQMELKNDFTIWGAVLIVQPRGVKSTPQPIQETADEDITSPSSSSPDNASQHYDFPDTVSLPKVNVRVPIFDLTKLLAKEDLDELARSLPYFQEGALFLQPGKTLPMKVILKLWALKSYMMN